MSYNFDLKAARNNLVVRDNRLIQNSRYALTNIENKALLYLISKIQPNDEPGKRYIFNCREFQALIKWNSESSYKNIKGMLTKLSDLRWWVKFDKDNEALVRWFNIVHMNKGTGDVEISFHEDMFPYLLNLKNKYRTAYKYQNVALMKNKYSSRIYDLIKSYQNNKKWVFENGTGSEFDLQRMICDTILDDQGKDKKPQTPKNWSNWAVFKRDVLNPAIEDINKYTDIKVAYEGKRKNIHKRKTRAIRTIEFYMVSKTSLEQRETDKFLDDEYAEIEAEQAYHQISMEEVFFQNHQKSLEEESKEKEIFEKSLKGERAKQVKHPLLLAELNETRQENFDECKINQLYTTAIKERVAGNVSLSNWELFATDMITYYYDKIISTAEDTKTTTYQRVLDCVKNDYDGEAIRLKEKYKK